MNEPLLLSIASELGAISLNNLILKNELAELKEKFHLVQKENADLRIAVEQKEQIIRERDAEINKISHFIEVTEEKES